MHFNEAMHVFRLSYKNFLMHSLYLLSYLLAYFNLSHEIRVLKIVVLLRKKS
jgi:hypothetical protein